MKLLLRSILFWLIRIIGKTSTFTLRRRSYFTKQGRVPRILLVHPGHLGSVILATPVLHALKSQVPYAHISMIVSSVNRELIEHHPDLDQLLICPFPDRRLGNNHFIRSWLLLVIRALQLRREQYDLAINLSRVNYWWVSALLALSGIPRRVGAETRYGSQFLTTAVELLDYEHATVSLLRITSAGLQALGYKPLEEPYTVERYPLYFKSTDEDQQRVAELLKEQGIAEDAHLVIIQAGTGGNAKLWTTTGWAACATRLHRRLSAAGVPVNIILTGSHREYPLLKEIADHMEIPATLISQVTLGQLAALFARAEIVLGVDSGALHLASTQQTATVKIFGPTDYHVYSQWADAKLHSMLAAEQRCPTCPDIPCGRMYLPSNLPDEFTCMRQISEQQVYAVACRHLTHLLPEKQVCRKIG
ncbi:glycosyltransferase family 9 protein [Ktedonosporobacter rubrisoli]|uniref:Glycosyltransferase family 9 protein n=1 Tax=Ktedonosporobacter rubrisoli TaxID=2509675 RepID=A0A4P6JM02_KTERU|nr:glycosyltransferase family 9 protein [Ktedonosporobacter rubrisoli]QBD76255.1 glycosyltransferase family 9 protein [Ktedonosporobacter rubrisoli]